MQSTTTIREQLDLYLREHHMTINRFADISKVNSGTLSNIINGNRPISMQQLDRITAGMKLSEGYFYEIYIEECIFHVVPNWRRLGVFLQRCAELNKLKCLEQAVNLSLDSNSYITQLFDTAEGFYKDGKDEAAILIYKCLAEIERYQHSERLALCQYRLFTLRLSNDLDSNLLAVVQFEPFIDRLDEDYQLDALGNLINVNLTLNSWEKVDELAEKMINKAMVQYRLYLKTNKNNINTKRPLIVYILYGYLIRSKVSSEFGDYIKALEYVELYFNPIWIVNPNNDELLYIRQYNEWGKLNLYLYQLMSGNVEVLDDYIECVAAVDDEIFQALCDIVITANKQKLDIDHIIERFSEHIVYREFRNLTGKYNNQVILNRYTRLLVELGIYYIHSKNYEPWTLLYC